MSIKGIDTQIMITRSSDFVKDTSAIQRHPETSQEHLAAQSKLDSAQDQSRVAATTESEMENIRTDVDGEGSGAAGGGGGGSGDGEEDTEEEQINATLLVPPGNNIIDITI